MTMSAAPAPSLTPRQQAVIERIDRRVPIKVIAQELGVSETRINQHIRALKDIYAAESLNELVEKHRIGQGRNPADSAESQDAAPGADAAAHSESLLRELIHADSGALGGDAQVIDPARTSAGEPKVVPEIFDGPNGKVMRLLAIVGLAIGIIGLFFMVTAASVKLSNSLKADRLASSETAK